MIELMIGAMIVALWVKTVPEAIADMVTTLRASKAGEWDVINKDRDRKAARSAARAEARRKAFAAMRARRNRQAGGDGIYRPGAAAWLGDVYHGLWEDQLEKRTAKRGARPPVGPDGKRPKASKLDEAVEAKVGARRAKTGYVGRVARALIDPVGKANVDRDAEPILVDIPEPAAATDGPRTACPECGSTLTRVDGKWRHPEDADCGVHGLTHFEAPGVESSVVHADDDTYTVRAGPPQYLTCPRCGQRHPATTMAKIDGERACPNCAAEFLALLAEEMNKRQPAPNADPDATVASATPRAENTTAPTSNGGPDMSTGTVDLVDYSTAVAEHERALEALREQLNQAIEFGLHLTGATAAVEQMDAGRGAITNTLGPLAEGMEGSRYGADSTQGSVEATTTLTAGSIAGVQENIEAAAEQNNRWIDELNAAIEGVQASLQHIKSQYGEAAATVQETGIDARALEEH